MLELSKVKGIGPKTEMLLNKIGITNIDDLVTHYPFRYDVLKRSNLKEVSEEDKIVIDGKVESIPLIVRFKGGLNKLNFRLATPQGPVGVSIFNRAFLKPQLEIGTSIIVLGKFDQKKNIINASDIKFGALSSTEKIEPVYHTTSGLNQKTLSGYINNVLLKHGNDIEDKIPRYLLDKYDFLNKKTALNIVHNPPNFEKLKEASMRLKYEELFEFMFKINYLRLEKEKSDLGINRQGNKKDLDKIIKSLSYELTSDQRKVLNEIIEDLDSDKRMNRIIQGDVGSGKTIVSFLAMYYNYLCGYQSALMAPTEILAMQHYNTFKERFKNFPVRIEYLSRSKTAKEVKDILAALKEGKIDILIGTHKLVGKQVVWKDLGLLIIDEEQKFGVAVKEKLKALRTNVDVLTLTATPIPRTLQFSLLGARDLSVINTPPPNRYPVQTEMITLDDEDIMKEAIELEMQRNGQIYVVCNRIEMLPRIEQRIQRMLPEARTVIAHGQMPPGEMEKALEDFINYEYDILIATTIIESGIDISNVNTIIIHSAQNYGLSDLHQLRGRVGRSNRKAYCYLVTPDKELLTQDARRRLQALTTFAELGAGFQLAMQDLDIRGAGNMLGSEQSGFIADLGYDTYQRILNEAVEEIRDEMQNDPSTSGLFASLDNRKSSKNWCQDSQLDSDLPLCFPVTYIENISERISLYRELDSLNNEEELVEYQKRLIDRFGALPEEAEQLLNVVRLRWLCCKMGIEKVLLKKENLTLYFTQSNKQFWQSEMFSKIVEFVYSRAQRCKLVEEKDRQGKKTGRIYASVQQVNTITGALHLLNKILNPNA
mgnify:CR=1 FL=1